MQRLGHSQILAGRDLEVLPILNFEEFLLGEENAVDSRSGTIESASLRDLEPKFINSQTFDF
jgi:hypothetical protein